MRRVGVQPVAVIDLTAGSPSMSEDVGEEQGERQDGDESTGAACPVCGRCLGNAGAVEVNAHLGGRRAWPPWPIYHSPISHPSRGCDLIACAQGRHLPICTRLL